MFSSTKKASKLTPIDDQLLLMPANKLSKLIKEGSLSSAKLCQLFVDRINQVQPFINAMTQDRFREALNEARQIDQMLVDFKAGKPEAEFTADQLEMLRSPLLGVPITIKESIQMRSMRNSCGLWERRNVTASSDAVTVANVKRSGLVPICTTNVPECTLYWADCQNKVYGRTKNPYDLSRIPGASSGGEGALLGAGASVIGVGSDIGGSLRIPAHCCGVFSHKPSPFLVSAEGNYPEVLGSRLRLFTMGPMCRYATDLRPLFKCLMSDKGNLKQDTYYKFQPDNISQARNELMQKLDEPVDLSKIKLFYFNFNQSSALKGKQSVKVQSEIIEAQQEVMQHFRSKFSTQLEHINLDKYLKKTMITWQCMLRGGGTADRETNFDPEEVEKMFGINSIALEFLKMPLGLSNHTKESLLAMLVVAAVPKEREKAFALCERFEKHAADLRTELLDTLGETGVLVTPTLPQIAYKHNVPLLKTPDIRFPSMLNCMQLPATHATVKLTKKQGLPFGFTFSSRPFNDHLTIALAEEVEIAFGGWRPPSGIRLPEESQVEAELKQKPTLHNSQDVQQVVA